MKVADADSGVILADVATLEEILPGDDQADEREDLATALTRRGETIWGGGAAPAFLVTVLPA